MNSLSQVWHVARKDVREHRWLALAYVAIVAAAALKGAGWPLLDRTSMLSTFLVMLFALVLVASMVQGDSPTEKVPFWATRPLDPRAVLGAKLFEAAAVTAIAAAGQFVALWLLDLPWAKLPDELWAGVATCLFLLLGGIVAAALTGSLRSFFLAFAGLMALFTVAGMAVGQLGWAAPLWVSRVTGVLTPLLILGALGWLYASRDTSRLSRTGMGAVVLLTSLAGANAKPPQSGDTVRRGAPRPALSLALEADARRFEPGKLNLVVDVPALPVGWKYGILDPIAAVRLRNGKVLDLPATMGFTSLNRMTESAVVPVYGLKWIGREASTATGEHVQFRLTAEQRRELAGGIAGVTLRGRMVVARLEIVDTMPLAAGSQRTRDGRRVRVEEWTDAFSQQSLSVRMSGMGDILTLGGVAAARVSSSLHFALLNVSRSEALPLRPTSSAMGLDGLVLPSSYEEVHANFTSAPGPGPAWMHGARLLVMREVPQGGYPISITARGDSAAH